jgi:hypothetical protein
MEGSKLTTKKKIMAGVLIAVIIVMTALAIILKDQWFIQRTTITYPDGCKEKYENDILLTDVCENGRFLEEQNSMRRQRQWPMNTNLNFSLNITLVNLT